MLKRQGSIPNNFPNFFHRAIKERKRFIALILHNRRQNQTTLAKCSTVEDLVLFVIVITFFLCTLPR